MVRNGIFYPDFGGLTLQLLSDRYEPRVYSALEIQVMDAGEEYTLIHDASVPAGNDLLLYEAGSNRADPETEYDMNRSLSTH